jgi:hypothetical protein
MYIIFFFTAFIEGRVSLIVSFQFYSHLLRICDLLRA